MTTRTLKIQIAGSADATEKALVAASDAKMPEKCPRDAGTSGGAADTTKG